MTPPPAAPTTPDDDVGAAEDGEARGDDARKDARILGKLPDWALWLLVPACL